jgi:hypothetical protein
MDDLAHVAIGVEPPRNLPRLAEREQLLREPRSAPEIDEPDMVARRVECIDAEGRARAAARPVVLRGERDDDLLRPGR